MNIILIRLLLSAVIVLGSLAILNAQTVTLSYGDPAASATEAFDGNVFQSGTQIGDASIYAILSGGAQSFQIVSPGESLTRTVSSTGFFAIRPTASMIVDQSKIFSFSGTVTGSVAITVKPLTITTLSTSVTETTPGSELTISYLTGAGTFPVGLVAGKFNVELLDAAGNRLGNLLSATDQYANGEKQASSRGGTRFIKATIPANTPSGTYRVRVVTQGLTVQVLGTASGLFTIKTDTTPVITAGTLSSSYCAGSSVSFPFSTTGSFPVGNSFKIQLVDATGSTLQDLPGTSTASLVSATLPATLAAGTYRFRIAATATSVVSNTNTISISVLPTMTISGGAAVTSGATAPVQLAFTGTPPWSFTYTDNSVTRAASSSVSSTTITPTFLVSTAYDKSFIKSFQDAGCGVSDAINGSAQIVVNQITLTTIPPSGSYCPGVTIPVAFTTNGSLPAGVVYQVQLSDGLSNFANAQFVGSGATSPISIALPASLSSGSGYRIQVVIQKPTTSGSVDYSGLASSVPGSLTVSRPDMPKVSDISLCSSATVPLPLSATGTNLKWYTSNTSPQSLTAAPIPSNTQSSTYFVTQTDANNCESARSSISVSVVATLAGPAISSFSLCQGTQAQFSTTLANVVWYTALTGGTGSSQPPLINSQAIGDKTVYASQAISGCESARTTVTATVVATPTSPTLTQQSTLCQFSMATSLTATGLGLTWYGPSGKLAGAPTPNTSLTGTQSFSVSQTVDGCEGPRAAVTVAILPTPAPPSANSVSFCSGVTPTAPLSATGTNLKWYTSSANSQSLISAPIPSSSQPGPYYVSQTVDGCESIRQPVSVSIIATLAIPTVNSVSLCQGGPGQFSTPLSNLLWYTTATGGVGSPQPPKIDNQRIGDLTVYVSQTAIGCESPRAEVKATVYEIPTVPAMQSLSLCQNTTPVSLTANGSALTWYGPSGKLAGAPTPNTSLAGTQSYSVSQTDKGCESPRALISVSILPAPALPTASGVQFCVNELPRLIPASGSNLRWYTTETGGIGTPTSSPFLTDVPKPIPLYVTQTDAKGCESPRLLVSVSVVAAPAAPTVTATQFACQSAVVGALTASPGTGLIWQGPGITGSSDVAPIPSTILSGSAIYSVVQKVGSCTSVASQIVFTVRQAPDKPTVQSTTLCVGTTGIPLSATATGRLTWYTNADRSGPATDKIIPNTDRANVTSYYVTQKDANNCESQVSEVQVRVSAKATAQLTGDGEVYPGDVTAIRVRLTGDAPWTFTDWNGNPVVANDSIHVIWDTPTVTRTYAITNLRSGCGTGTPPNSYTLTVKLVLGTQAVAEPMSVRAYPNPTTGNLSVEWSSPTRQTVVFQLINAEGKVMEQFTRQATGVQQTERIQLNNHPVGAYFLNVTTPESGKLTRRILKQ